ncbi:FtsW/RodA/SpoVE family cell cycle protein [Actinomycetaceae bacterium L2_0104]
MPYGAAMDSRTKTRTGRRPSASRGRGSRIPKLRYFAGRMPESEEEARRVRDIMHQSIIFAVVATFFLLVLGIVMVYSATGPSSIRELDSLNTVGAGTFKVANTHMILSLVGVALAIVAALLPVQLYLIFANVLFAFGLMLQSLIFITGSGRAAGGNLNWLRIGSFSMQPSEFLKLATVVWLAAWLSQLRKHNRTLRDYLIPSGVGAMVALVLVLLGRDLGTGLIFMMITAGMLWLADISWKYLAAAGGLAAVGVAILVLLEGSRSGRFAQYFDHLIYGPDPSQPSQPDFALWAFGSGGIGGSGLGTGAEKWPGNLAEAQTDYIFAVVGEELGLLGCLVVVGMFALLGWSLYRICRYHPSPFGRLVVGGIGIWLCGQACANMMVVTALLPVFGVPLPFMSQGGTAAIACLLGVAVAISAALAVPGVRESFRVRPNLAYRARAVMKRGSHE